MKKFLPKNLRFLYKRAGLTQIEYGERLGLSRGKFESYVRGVAEPSLEFAAKICNENQITIEDLLYSDLEANGPKNQTIYFNEDILNNKISELEDKLRQAEQAIVMLTQIQLGILKDTGNNLTVAEDAVNYFSKKKE